MKFAGMLAVTVLVAGLGFGGCEETGKRVDSDKEMIGDRGLQSRDLREMTDKMAPDLLQIPEIVRNPYKVVVVMKPIENHLEADPGRDLTIYVARLKTLLNGSQTRDKIAFVEPQQTLRNYQAQELGGTGDPFETAGRTGALPQDPRVVPQYYLTGTFYEKNEAKSSYFLCTFRLTDFKSGVQVWENSYEVKRLN